MISTDLKSNLMLLPNGKCGNCGAHIKLIEDEWIVVKNRLLKIHKENGTVKIKCPGCKELITFLAFN